MSKNNSVRNNFCELNGDVPTTKFSSHHKYAPPPSVQESKKKHLESDSESIVSSCTDYDVIPHPIGATPSDISPSDISPDSAPAKSSGSGSSAPQPNSACPGLCNTCENPDFTIINDLPPNQWPPNHFWNQPIPLVESSIPHPKLPPRSRRLIPKSAGSGYNFQVQFEE